MADVNPFRGLRYDLGQVGSLSDVTAPPYDVISPEQQRELYELHPCNVIRLILNRDEPGDADPRGALPTGRHVPAALAVGTNPHPANTKTPSTSTIRSSTGKGRHYVRQGFMARVRIEEFGKGQIYPHEQTLAGPKADRLALTKACKMNLSPGLRPLSRSDRRSERRARARPSWVPRRWWRPIIWAWFIACGR